MRFNLLVVCLVGLFLFNASRAVAADDAASVKQKTNGVKPGEKGVEKMIAGPVVSVNIDKKEIAVGRNGKQYQILTDGSTRIMSGKEPLTLDKIKAGDAVIISYLRFSDGSRIALTIKDKSISPVASNKSAGKTEIKAEPKKEASAAPKTEAKAEPKTGETAAQKTETKAEPKKETSAAPKAEAKAEPKAGATAAPKTEVKTEPKKDAAVKDSLAALRPAKTQN